MRVLIAALCFFLVSACANNYPEAQPSLTVEEAVYQLQPNDTVQLRVYGEKELSGTYVVDSRGMIALPLAGKVTIANQSEQQAAATIRQALQHGGYLKNPKVALEIAKARPFFVLGEVEKAGSFPYHSGVTVYEAVALAGGYTYRADRSDIVIRRKQRYQAREDTPVLPGDVIEVGERYF